MGMNSLTTLRDSLRGGTNVIEIDAELITQAMIPLQRMLDFAVANQLQVKGKA
jgi:quinolinate synthase